MRKAYAIDEKLKQEFLKSIESPALIKDILQKLSLKKKPSESSLKFVSENKIRSHEKTLNHFGDGFIDVKKKYFSFKYAAFKKKF